MSCDKYLEADRQDLVLGSQPGAIGCGVRLHCCNKDAKIVPSSDVQLVLKTARTWYSQLQHRPI